MRVEFGGLTDVKTGGVLGLQDELERSFKLVAEPRPTSCHPHTLPPDPYSRMLVCQRHTQTTTLHPRPHPPPTQPPILTHPWIQHPLSAQIPPSPQQHLKFRLSLFYSTAKEGHCDLEESLP